MSHFRPFVVFVVLAGCTPNLEPTPLGPDHPANPAAPEAAPLAIRSLAPAPAAEPDDAAAKRPLPHHGAGHVH